MKAPLWYVIRTLPVVFKGDTGCEIEKKNMDAVVSHLEL